MKLPVVTPEDGNEDNVADTPAENKKTLKESSLPRIESSPVLYQVGTPDAPVLNKERSNKTPLIIILVILLLLAAAYVGLSVFFMSHYTFNSTVNGTSIAFMTPAEVNESLQKDIERYSLSIEARGDQRAAISSSQIDLRYLDSKRLEDALTYQQPWAWPFALIFNNSTNIQQVNVEFDQKKFTDTLASILFLNEENMRPPADASLDFQGNAYVIIEADEGTTLDLAAATKAISEAIHAGDSTLNLEELNLYENPVIPSDEPSLVTDRDTFNQYVPFKITYIFGDNREVLDGYTTIDWVNTAGEAPYTLNYDAVVAWVANLADRYDTLEGPRGITNGFGEQKRVEGGTFGWMLDQESECWAIMNAAALQLGEERQAYWLNWGLTFDGDNDWGDTYLEVDMTRQYMWYYVDGVCVLETDVITGNPNTGYETPQGVWYIYSKTPNVVTRGRLLPDGSYEWEVPVSYWMPFTPSGCGFHDAYWQPSFGGTYYLWRGSHGCINMPPHLAAELFDILEPGTPVITHY